MNPDNHAYVADKSCLTAVLALMEYYRKIRHEAKDLKKEGEFLVPILDAEDISSAFESIDHDMTGEVVEEAFSEVGDFNLKGVIKSYLTRTSWIHDRTTGEKLKLNDFTSIRHHHKARLSALPFGASSIAFSPVCIRKTSTCLKSSPARFMITSTSPMLTTMSQ